MAPSASCSSTCSRASAGDPPRGLGCAGGPPLNLLENLRVGGNLLGLWMGAARSMSVGASGAVFGLFAVSVLVKLSFNPKKFIESAILGQFVYQQVANEVRMQAGKFGGKHVMAGSTQVSHVAHLAGALAGVLLILMISRLPAAPSRK